MLRRFRDAAGRMRWDAIAAAAIERVERRYGPTPNTYPLHGPGHRPTDQELDRAAVMPSADLVAGRYSFGVPGAMSEPRELDHDPPIASPHNRRHNPELDEAGPPPAGWPDTGPPVHGRFVLDHRYRMPLGTSNDEDNVERLRHLEVVADKAIGASVPPTGEHADYISVKREALADLAAAIYGDDDLYVKRLRREHEST